MIDLLIYSIIILFITIPCIILLIALVITSLNDEDL
jgi:hypothetical protein